MHAALRRAGAAYSWASVTSGRMPGTAVLPATISYRYIINTWNMGLWRLVCRSSTVVVHMTLSPSGELDLGGAAVIVPSCLKSFGSGFAEAESCARSPSDFPPHLRR